MHHLPTCEAADLSGWQACPHRLRCGSDARVVAGWAVLQTCRTEPETFCPRATARAMLLLAGQLSGSGVITDKSTLSIMLPV